MVKQKIFLVRKFGRINLFRIDRSFQSKDVVISYLDNTTIRSFNIYYKFIMKLKYHRDSISYYLNSF